VSVHNVALSWQQAGLLTLGVLVVAVALQVGPVRLRRLAPIAREGAMIAGLYAVWQLAGEISVLSTDDAFKRADWIERVEKDLWLPSEASIQRHFIHDTWLTKAADFYYATMHFTGLFVFLLWLFLRHRERYRPIRRVLALTTLACLLIQLIPVAPPRLLPGYVDTARLHGMSVYGLGFDADQLSAMPSVHVAWAVLIAIAVAGVAHGPWRWIGAAHAAITLFVVVVTANHFWLDGIVAVAVLGVCALLERGAVRLIRRLRHESATPELRDGEKASILA